MADQKPTYDEYLSRLPADRRENMDRVWKVVRKNIGRGFVEDVSPQFLSFKAGEVWYVALANMKNYMSLHLMAIYAWPELRAELINSGKKLKTGKGCINFTKADDLPLELIGSLLRNLDAATYLRRAQEIRSGSKSMKRVAKKKKQ